MTYGCDIFLSILKISTETMDARRTLDAVFYFYFRHRSRPTLLGNMLTHRSSLQCKLKENILLEFCKFTSKYCQFASK